MHGYNKGKNISRTQKLRHPDLLTLTACRLKVKLLKRFGNSSSNVLENNNLPYGNVASVRIYDFSFRNMST